MQRLSNTITDILLCCAPWALAGGILWGLWVWINSINLLTLFILLAAFLAISFVYIVVCVLGYLLSLIGR